MRKNKQSTSFTCLEQVLDFLHQSPKCIPVPKDGSALPGLNLSLLISPHQLQPQAECRSWRQAGCYWLQGSGDAVQTSPRKTYQSQQLTPIIFPHLRVLEENTTCDQGSCPSSPLLRHIEHTLHRKVIVEVCILKVVCAGEISFPHLSAVLKV